MVDENGLSESQDPSTGQRDDAATVLETLALKIREGTLAGFRVEWSAADPGTLKLAVAPMRPADHIYLDLKVDI